MINVSDDLPAIASVAKASSTVEDLILRFDCAVAVCWRTELKWRSGSFGTLPFASRPFFGISFLSLVFFPLSLSLVHSLRRFSRRERVAIRVLVETTSGAIGTRTLRTREAGLRLGTAYGLAERATLLALYCHHHKVGSPLQ